MVLVVALHLVRVFYAGAYKKPREFNWVIGVMLLLLTLAFSFTGYLLPWDQLAYWAVTVGTDLVHYVPLVGGKLQDLLIGGAAGRAEHAAALLRAARRRAPDARSSLMLAVHIWRVRKDGFAVQRTERRRVRRGGDRAARRRAGRAAMAQAAPELYGGRVRLLGVVDRESVTEAERPGRRHGVHVAAPARAPRRRRARHRGGRARPRRRVQPRRCAASRTRTSRPSRRRRRGTSPGSRSCSRTSIRSSPGSSFPRAPCSFFVLLPYIDRNPDTRARHRKVAIVLFSVLLAIAVVLTVIGTFFRGPGLEVRRAVDPLVHRVLGAIDGRHEPTRLPPRRLEGRRRAADRRRRRTPATRRCARSRPARAAPRSPSATSRASPTDTSTYVPAGRMYVVNANDYLFALSQKCPHLGCHVPFCESSGRFECPCHGSVFDLAGEYITGPGAARAWTATRSTLDGQQRRRRHRHARRPGPTAGAQELPHAAQGPELHREGLTCRASARSRRRSSRSGSTAA